MMSHQGGWQRKFAVAIAGIFWSIRSHSSFRIHLPIATGVIALAAWLQIEAWRWTAVLIAITSVLSAELLNTSIEQLVKVLHPQQDERVGHALDAAAGGVLIASIGAVAVGLLALGWPLWESIRSLQ